MNSVADQIAEFLAETKTPAVFQLSGGMIAFISDAISQKDETPLINLKHEQAAGFAGECLSRFGGNPSVVLATSGPGATNLVTPIASCYFDSSPVVFITGQVHSSEIKKSARQRQNGFQELEIARLVAPLVKFSHQISEPKEVLAVLREAWALATEGRPGPVLLDFPIDIQQMQAVYDTSPRTRTTRTLAGLPRPDFEEDLRVLETWLAESRNPLILAGAGIRHAKAIEGFRKLIEQFSIPVVWSLMAKDCLQTSHPLNFGMIGSYGNRCANRALAQSDLLIVLGSRLDVRQTGSSVTDFCQGRRIFRVDIDREELEGRISANHSVQSNLEYFLEAMLELDFDCNSRDQVSGYLDCSERHPSDGEQALSVDLSPGQIMADIGEMESQAGCFVVDVGQHQMWAAQSLQISEAQRFLTSGGLGAMGFSIPGAIGIAAGGDVRVAVIVGDGSAQVALSELETIKYLNLNVTIYVLNNNQHGMVAQFQDENLNSKYVGTREGYSAPDFVSVARAFGLEAIRIQTRQEMDRFKNLSHRERRGPLLVEIVVDERLKALPKLGGKTTLYNL